MFRYAGNKYLLTMSRRTKSNALFSSVGTSYCFFKTMNLLLACKYVYNIRVSMLLPSFWTVLSTLHLYCSPGLIKEVATSVSLAFLGGLLLYVCFEFKHAL